MPGYFLWKAVTFLFWLYMALWPARPTVPAERPTYTCFYDSLLFLETMLHNDKRIFVTGKVYLVHGTCADRFKQYSYPKYFHSWVEIRNDNLLDAVCVYAVREDRKIKYVHMPRMKFYREFGVLKAKYYTPAEAFDKYSDTRWTGPWADDPGVINGKIPMLVLR